MKHKQAYWVGVFLTLTLAYFVWLSWNKLTEFLGDTTWTWLITGVIVVIGLYFGKISLPKILERI